MHESPRSTTAVVLRSMTTDFPLPASFITFLPREEWSSRVATHIARSHTKMARFSKGLKRTGQSR